MISIVVTLISLLLLWVSGVTGRGSMPAFNSIPKWAFWLGGVCAAYYLIASLVALPKLGATAVFSLVIAGQLITALILDSTGAFGVPQLGISSTRIIGHRPTSRRCRFDPKNVITLTQKTQNHFFRLKYQ